VSEVNSGLSDLFGRPEQIAVERALAEFRSGRPVVMTGAGEHFIILPAEGITDELLASFRRLCAPVRPHLVISKRRARALGLAAAGPVGLTVSERDDAAAILSFVADARVEQHLDVVPAASVAAAAIEIAKLAQRLPALLVAQVDAADFIPCDPPLMQVSADAVAGFRDAAIHSLSIVTEANIPLNGGLPARFVIFRDAIGGSSTAVILGAPDFAKPVAVRLHSACLTGDVFGSRRCDCGDQLRLSIGRLEEKGGGIILYLDQEGRGLGLANKMRTYRLQDAGFDTLDANTALGFDDDERDYGVAVRMLQMLGCPRVRLLTNNPAKVEGLSGAGIEVVGQIALHGPVNSDNRRYLNAKATRAGHKFDHLLSVLAEGEPVGDKQTP
jgi:GTP cyclohydrolase II